MVNGLPSTPISGMLLTMIRITLFVVVFALAALARAQDPDAASAKIVITEAEVNVATMRGVAILLEMQSGDGRSEWPYEGVYRVRREIPMGYRIGGTAIAIMALLEAPGLKDDEERIEAISRGLAFIVDGVDDADMSEEKYDGGYDVRGWGYIYGLDALLAAKTAGVVPARLTASCESAAASYLAALEAIELPETGGWNYARPDGRDTKGSPSTFMTGPAVQVLLAARSAGIEVDDAILQRAITFLEKARNASGSIQYAGFAPSDPKRMEATPGAVGRMVVTNATLLMAGRGNLADLRGSIDGFIVHWEWLNIRRAKTGTHVAPYSIAPYYFMYAHRYAAQAVECLPPNERAEYRRRINGLLFSVRQEGGEWNDRVFDRSAAYGTAMAMLAMNEPNRSRAADAKPSVPAQK